MTEQLKLKILAVYGHTPDELNAADANTALSIMFDEDYDNPADLLGTFLQRCSREEFMELKLLIEHES